MFGIEVTEEEYNRQLRLEEEGIQEGIHRFKNEVVKAKQKGTFAECKVGTILTYQLVVPMIKVSTELENTLFKQKHNQHIQEVLREGTAEANAYIAIKILLQCIGTNKLTLTKVCKAIGRAIVDDINLNRGRKHREEGNTSTCDTYIEYTIKQKHRQGSSKERTMEVLKTRLEAVGFHFLNLDDEDLVWIGQKLLEGFIKETGLIKIPLVNVGGGKTDRVVTPTDEFMRYISKLEGECELMNPIIYPMIIPPRRHGRYIEGGFLTDAKAMSFPFVKTPHKKNPKYLDDVDMDKVYEAVNTIQEVPWKINKNVLEVLRELIQRGKEIEELDLPATTEVEMPVRPWGFLQDAEWEKYKSNNPEIVADWKQRTRDTHNKNVSQKTKRVLYRSLLSMSEKFKDEVFYYCYNLDWRGRIYPIQNGTCPNPQGIDASKALICFAKGEPLGKRGAFWLSVQGANTFGADKIPMSERGLWASLNEDKIVQVANDPLSNHWWWEADEPWQFLAFCFEWAGYVASNYSEDFVGYIPVAMDGSCSGIQHFSALLLDRRGAKATNVINGEEDRPADIYGEVAKVVAKKVAEDAYNGVPEAMVLDGKIDRSVCKRNTMTTPYGVTVRGMVDQLVAELDKVTFSNQYTPFIKVCQYLAQKNYESIGEVVVASRGAMDWLKDVAKVMQKANKVFYWTTPSGFKVRQAYYKSNTKRIATFWGGVRVRLSLDKPTKELNHKKTVAGQSPNYIHSMDASHLVLTALKAKQKGVHSFAFIHDSFGTHAGKTEELNYALREAFVDMYSTCNLTKFRDEIMEQLPDVLKGEIPPIPNKGTLDIKEVMDSTYFFS